MAKRTIELGGDGQFAHDHLRRGDNLMVSADNDPVNEAWDKVSSWSASWRLSLATRLLNSLDGSTLSPAQCGTPGDLVGAWKVPQPPSDTEVERILDEERQRKCGDTSHD